MSLAQRLSRRLRKKPARKVGKLPKMSSGVITQSVMEVDRLPEASRLSTGYVHVSSLLDFCPRRVQLAKRSDEKHVNFPKSQDRLLWAIGRSVEAHIRGNFIKHVKRQGVIGKWKCACGKTSLEGFWNDVPCPVCRKTCDKYCEAVVFDHAARICGSPDLLWEKEEDGILVVEIKSINKKGFDELTRPHANHVFQAACYHKMLANTGKRMFPELSIVYGCKDYSFTGEAYKEYFVSAESAYPLVDGAFSQVEELREAERRGEAIDRLPICATSDTPTAKKCPMCVQCFSYRQ